MIAQYKEAFLRYADFGGRTSRSGYWWFVLANLLVICAFDLVVFGSALGGMKVLAFIVDLVLALYTLGSLIPSLAIAVRRLHDTDRSGWWLLIEFIPLVGWIILLVFLCQASTAGTNRFGVQQPA